MAGLTVNDVGDCCCPGTTCNYHIHVDGCSGGLPGATVTIKSGGTPIDSGTTDSSGDWTPSVSGGPYTITVAKSRYNTSTFGVFTLCSSVVNLSMAGNAAPGYVCLGFVNCPDPAKTVLTATHSIFGATTATYNSFTDSWSFSWAYAYPGFGSCTAQPVTVRCALSNSTGPGVIGWDICTTGFVCTFSTAAGCPITPGSGGCADGAGPSLTSSSCPPAFVAAYDITYSVTAGTCQSFMYGGVTGPNTFTLTLSE